MALTKQFQPALDAYVAAMGKLVELEKSRFDEAATEAEAVAVWSEVAGRHARRGRACDRCRCRGGSRARSSSAARGGRMVEAVAQGDLSCGGACAGQRFESVHLLAWCRR